EQQLLVHHLESPQDLGGHTGPDQGQAVCPCRRGQSRAMEHLSASCIGTELCPIVIWDGTRRACMGQRPEINHGLRALAQVCTVSQPETRLGELLIQRRLITASDLQEALDAQKEAPAYVPLGQLLIDRGLVTRRQLHLLLDWAKKQPKLGELLIKAGAISEAQLSRALEEQPQFALPLGETLIKLGYVT